MTMSQKTYLRFGNCLSLSFYVLLLSPAGDDSCLAAVHHHQDVHHHLEGADQVPSARWCGAVRAFARGAEPLAGNEEAVAGQRLSPSGGYRPLGKPMPPRASRG